MQIIAFDSHKHYTLARVEKNNGNLIAQQRINHEKGNIRQFLARCEPSSPVAVETIGNWYWIIDEIEQADMRPRLVHARKAKLMIGCVNKTDKLDVKGLNQLQRAGTLPTVWIPSQELRDKRDLLRTRMYLVHIRTGLKNRIQAALAKYALQVSDYSDVFGKKARTILNKRLAELPEHTRFATLRQLEELDHLEEQIERLNQKIKAVFEQTEDVRLLRTIPGVGLLLAVVISQEIGDVKRFAAAEKLAAYSGTTPRVHASGGKIRYGSVRSDVNRYLKWAFAEAGNSICRNRQNRPERHVSRLYQRIWQKKGHSKAVGAVSRHLAEASYWILTKKEAYKEPNSGSFSSRQV